MHVQYSKRILLFALFVSLISCSEKRSPEAPPSFKSINDSTTLIPVRTEAGDIGALKHNQKTNFENVSTGNLYKELNGIASVHKIDAGKDTILKCKQGTLLEIKSASFLLDGKPYRGEVKIKVQECYTPEDMIMANLTTMSNGRMLESGGMVNIEAFAGNHPLTLDKNHPFTLRMPALQQKPYMQLFYAEQKNGSMNWIQANTDKPVFANSQNSLRRRAPVLFSDKAPLMIKVCVIKDGQEIMLSNTKYFNREICRTNRDSIVLQFETDNSGRIFNLAMRDTSMNKASAIMKYKLKSLTRNHIIYKPYRVERGSIPENALLFKALMFTGKGRDLDPFFIVPVKDRLRLMKYTDDNSRVKVIVRNYYYNHMQYTYRTNESWKRITDTIPDDVSDEALQYYVFSANQLGWINCDRFYNVPVSKKTNFVIYNAGDEDVKLVFSNFRSVMSGTHEGNRIVFYNIPENEPVTLVGIRVKNQRAQLAIMKTTVNNRVDCMLKYSTVTIEEMKKKISESL